MTGKTDNLKFCTFCGKQCHKSKITRKRKDPQNPSKFSPICDKCNTKYLEMHILEPYWKTHSKLKEMVRKREKEVNELENKIGKVNMEIKNCDRQVSFLHLTKVITCLDSN